VKTFDYRGFDFDGRVRKGLLEALDVKDAREKLARTGILADRILAAGDHAANTQFSKKSGFSLDQRSVVYRELGTLLRAGLPMVRALEVLIDSPEMGEGRGLLARTRDDIKEGVSLAEALGKASKSVTVMEQALIAVGERSGTLGDALDRLATYLEEQQVVKDRVRTALMYPAIVVAVALVVAVGVFVFVLPQTGKVLAGMRIEVPAITRLMIWVGRVLAIGIVPIVAILTLLVLRARRRIGTEPASRMEFDRKCLLIPVLGRGTMILANLRFSRTLSILLHGGVPLVEGLQLAGRATGNTWIEHLSMAAAESVKHGGSLSDAVRSIQPLSETLPGWIQAGEASGNLEGLLLNASDRYQRQWMRFVSRSLGLLEPIVILCLGIFVLLVALAVLLPIISANEILK